MRAERWNPSTWIRRLWGPQSRISPEIIPSVQPVMLVADQGRLIPPIQGPVALSGFRTVGTAGNFTSYQLTCYAPGGLYIRGFQLASDQAVPANTHNSTFNWAVGPMTNPATGAVSLTTLTPGQPAVSKASSSAGASRLGELPITGDTPKIFGGTDLSAPQLVCPFFHWNPGLYVAPGFSFFVETSVTQCGLAGFVLFDEIPAIPAEG